MRTSSAGGECTTCSPCTRPITGRGASGVDCCQHVRVEGQRAVLPREYSVRGLWCGVRGVKIRVWGVGLGQRGVLGRACAARLLHIQLAAAHAANVTLGLRVWVLRARLLGLGSWIWGVESGVWGLGSRVWGVRDQGSRTLVLDLSPIVYEFSILQKRSGNSRPHTGLGRLQVMFVAININ